MRSYVIANFLVAGLLASLASVRVGQAASLQSDFLVSPSQSNTASNSWQYFYDVNPENRNGSYPRLNVYDTAAHFTGVEGWGLGDNSIPLVAKNTTNGTISDSGTFALPANAVFVHPENGGGNEAVAVAYRVPATAFYNLSGTITDIDTGNVTGIAWYLDRNAGNVLGNVLDSGNVSSGGNDSFSLLSVPLNANDLVYLIVSNGPLDDYGSDSTRLQFVVNPVPEPATSVLALVTLPFAVRVLRRRNSK